VDVQRAGPSTGLPTLPAQADMMQVRWGSHGDYGIIALSPNSPQECFNLTIEAFNLAETYRVPTFLMMDESVGHMTERVVIPPADEIEVVPRRYTSKPPGEYLPYEPEEDLVPAMVRVGRGYNVHVTGLTHDERGYPMMNATAQDRLIRRLVDKIRKNAHKIARYEESRIEGADVVVVSYGITSRVAMEGIRLARENGIKVGILRLVVVWPFPGWRIAELAGQIKAFVVPELNMGQMVLEVERYAAGQAKTLCVPHAGGTVHDPKEIATVIEEAVK
jgi:2-oxoglutarate ferredoxin oxidoreductase subunit alpha